MSEMSDEPGDALAARLKEAYNPPPATPREEMWQAVEAGLHPRAGAARSLEGVRGLQGGGRRVSIRPGAHRPWAWAVAAAALLVLGIGIGRLSPPGGRGTVGAPSGEVVSGGGSHAPSAEPDGRGEIVRWAALDHLGRTEPGLALARADGRDGALDAEVRAWAGEALARTRLFLDAGGASDPALTAVLEDLELVLAQIVGAGSGRGEPAGIAEEVGLALRGIERTALLERIRTLTEAGVAAP